MGSVVTLWLENWTPDEAVWVLGNGGVGGTHSGMQSHFRHIERLDQFISVS